MSDLISRKEIIDRLERVIQNGVPSEDGMHPISAETVLEVVKELSEHGTNLAEVGTDCISRQAAIDALKDWYDGMIISSFRGIEKVIDALPPVQPETAKRIVGKSRDGMTLWYQCDMCNEPVDAQDNYCRGCGRRLIDG